VGGRLLPPQKNVKRREERSLLQNPLRRLWETKFRVKRYWFFFFFLWWWVFFRSKEERMPTGFLD